MSLHLFHKAGAWELADSSSGPAVCCMVAETTLRDGAGPEAEQPAAPPSIASATDDVAILAAAIRCLSTAASMAEITATVTPAARRLLGADGIAFVLREGDLCHYAEEDAIVPLWKGKRFPADACIPGWCMQQGRALAIRNIHDDDRRPHEADGPGLVRTVAMVPVRREDPVAAIGAYWAGERDVAAEELDLLQALADCAALALANVALRRKGAAEADLVRRESTHRIKNIFTVALALARQTEANDAESYRETLFGRLEALEQAHSAIADASHGIVPLAEILRRVLSAYVQNDRHRLDIEGDPVTLPGPEAADLALIMHELAANAVRHGAWSTPNGRVRVGCRESDGHVRLAWRESGGPPVALPQRRGIGTKLVEGLVAGRFGGQVSMEFARDGFSCELLLPLAKH